MQSKNVPEIRLLPIDDVIPTPENPRNVRPGKEIDSLAESIAAQGVLHPVLVRPHPTQPGKFDLRAGARRHMAARQAGLERIPAIVRELTDQEALEITVTENLQREELTPLEEAKGVQLLLDRGYAAADVAAHLGRPERWVHARARLTNLSEKWRKAIEDEQLEYRFWSASHLELVARLAPQAQDQFLEDYGSSPFDATTPPTIKDLEKQIADMMRTLKSVPWDLEDATLVLNAPACVDCPARASCQADLFEVQPHLPAKQDRCLDAVCFEAKGKALAARILAAAKQEKRPVVELITGYNGNYRLANSRSYTYFDKVKKSDEGALEGIVVDGSGAGTTVWVRKPDEVVYGPASSAGRKKASPAEQHKQKLERVRMQRAAYLGKEVSARLLKAPPPMHLEAVTLLALALDFGLSPSHGKWQKLRESAADELQEKFAFAVLEAVREEMATMPRTSAARTNAGGDFRALAELFRVDVAAIEAAALEKFPDPKKTATKPKKSAAPAKKAARPKKGKKAAKGVTSEALENPATAPSGAAPAKAKDKGTRRTSAGTKAKKAAGGGGTGTPPVSAPGLPFKD